MKKTFASDNYSGVHPKILLALEKANLGHEKAYGDDQITLETRKLFKKVFGECEVYFVYNGTGANVLALESMKKKASAVICPMTAHIFQDETGAPSKVTGMQLLPVPSSDGKLDLEKAKEYLSFVGSMHKVNPDIISITQATENGTIYSLEELKEIALFAKENNMLLHMDGARIANACATLGVSLKEMTADIGVDVLSFGGTKNGLMFGEALVFFNKNIAHDFERIQKQNLQLHSKQRFISAQYMAILESELWLKNAIHSNNMAKYLGEELQKIGVRVINKIEGNTVFAILAPSVTREIIKDFYFYVWNEQLNEVRFVTSFDHTKADIDAFVDKLKVLI